MPDIKEATTNKGSREGIFSDEVFIYDKQTDTYTCPAGKLLKRKSLHIRRQSMDYAASKKDCEKCVLMPRCTRSKSGRTVKRHMNRR